MDRVISLDDNLKKSDIWADSMRKNNKIIVLIIGAILIILGLAIMAVAISKQLEIFAAEQYYTEEYEMYNKYEQIGATFEFIGVLIIVFGVVVPFLVERKQKKYLNKTQETRISMDQIE